KGDSIRRAKLISRTFPDNTGRTGRRAQAAGDVPLWLLQTDALKDRVNNALWRDSPGPGYVHFPERRGGWFWGEGKEKKRKREKRKIQTVKKKKEKRKKGKHKREQIKNQGNKNSKS
ncbi:terminase gpA endonuclease subunit, partial [Escherichia coli]|uniref:terminase gpA endonuclease subunit n=1 Tax=Escherichia coli TaxID=562 RepID=UPI00202CDB0E